MTKAFKLIISCDLERFFGSQELPLFCWLLNNQIVAMLSSEAALLQVDCLFCCDTTVRSFFPDRRCWIRSHWSGAEYEAYLKKICNRAYQKLEGEFNRTRTAELIYGQWYGRGART